MWVSFWTLSILFIIINTLLSSNLGVKNEVDPGMRVASRFFSVTGDAMLGVGVNAHRILMVYYD